MLKVNKLTDYASQILSYMAQDATSSVSAGVLSEQLNLPFATVSKVLKLLTNSELLVSSRGATGGYRLNACPSLIRLPQIIEAIEGPIALTECSEKSSSCPQKDSCNMHNPWQLVSRTIYETLDKITLAQMMRGVQ